MYLKYGTYSHASREVGITFQRRSLVSETGYHYATRETWNITGFLQANDTAAVITAINSLVAAYRIDGQNIGLYLDSGTATDRRIVSANTMGGVRVIQEPSFLDDGVRTAEYSTFRSYAIVVEADIPVMSGNVILTWVETLDLTGTGGPLKVWLPTLVGPWQQQQTTDQSTYTVTQSGSAVGLRDWPVAATPIWPAAEHVEQRRIRRRTPRFRNGEQWEFPVDWSYRYESDASLTGTPTPI